MTQVVTVNYQTSAKLPAVSRTGPQRMVVSQAEKILARLAESYWIFPTHKTLHSMCATTSWTILLQATCVAHMSFFVWKSSGARAQRLVSLAWLPRLLDGMFTSVQGERNAVVLPGNTSLIDLKHGYRAITRSSSVHCYAASCHHEISRIVFE
jgi:hypothetical protein